jgi:hypothetical protein
MAQAEIKKDWPLFSRARPSMSTPREQPEDRCTMACRQRLKKREKNFRHLNNSQQSSFENSSNPIFLRNHNIFSHSRANLDGRQDNFQEPNKGKIISKPILNNRPFQ